MTIRTILVDDEKLAIQGLQLRLEPFEDVEVIETCQNGREAIRAIKTLKPDLVFLDIQMPGFDGFSVLIARIASRPFWQVSITSTSSKGSSLSWRPWMASFSSSTRIVRIVISLYLPSWGHLQG